MKINTGKYYYPVIRNEKVGCSIHLSGTNVHIESPLSER